MLLEGVRVLDLTRLLPGGYCTRLLLEQGAVVVKVEPPEGDPLRRMPAGDALFQTLHAGKRPITLDLRSAEGRKAFSEQVRGSDVVVEGFRPGVMERLQLGYEALAALNPRLVYCSITGYGSTGELEARAGHDLNYLARSGALSLMPRAEAIPVIPGLQVADLAGGLQAAFLIAAALSQRSSTGRGARVQVSMTDLMRDWTGPARAARDAGLPGLGLSGEFPCYHVYQVADGWMTVAALEPKFWAALCEVLGRADLISSQFDPAAIGELQPVFKSATRSDWERRFAGRDVCVEPVLTLEESEAGGAAAREGGPSY
jgi:alpha-methylacyl-CoA racemase